MELSTSISLVRSTKHWLSKTRTHGNHPHNDCLWFIVHIISKIHVS